MDFNCLPRKAASLIAAVALCLSAAPTSAWAMDASAQVSGVPMIPQMPELPTGCEATSLTMLLDWAGLHVSKTQVAQWIPTQPLPYQQNGTWYGGNPYVGFVGSPFSETGYGAFHSALYPVLQAQEPGRAADLSGQSFTNILATVDAGSPVMTWITIGLAAPHTTQTWQASNGGTVNWKAPEHAVVLTGYTATQAIVNDPWTGRTEHYDRSLFEERWEQMGSQALTIHPPANKSGFRDVADDNPYVTYISDLHSQGKISGMGDGTFHPNAGMTRAEFAALFVRVFGLKITHESVPFYDVPGWAYPYVQTLYANGITHGVGAGVYGADEPVTREQAATMVWNWLAKMGVPSAPSSFNPPLADVSEYAKNGVRNVLADHLYGPEVQNLEYLPKQNMTRAQAAALFDLAEKKLGGS